MATLRDSQERVRSTFNVFDVSNPGQPQLLSSVELRGWGVELAVSERYAYLSEYTHGLQVFDIGDPASPRRVGGNSTVIFNRHLALA